MSTEPSTFLGDHDNRRSQGQPQAPRADGELSPRRNPREGPSRVWCFDRDRTVDVNPHPSRRAVPLAWVRRLAQQPEHVVLATGNQTLKHEADIPGVDEIVAAWRDLDPEDQGRAAIEDPVRPWRRDRVRMVADLFPGCPVDVIDDVDLSDLEDGQVTHHFPWDLVAAVEDGTLEAWPLDRPETDPGHDVEADRPAEPGGPPSDRGESEDPDRRPKEQR